MNDLYLCSKGPDCLLRYVSDIPLTDIKEKSILLVLKSIFTSNFHLLSLILNYFDFLYPKTIPAPVIF